MTFRLDGSCNYKNALEQASAYLDEKQVWFGHGTDNSWDESVTLLLWAAALPMDVSDEILESPLEPDAAERFVCAINRRVDEQIPAAYITQQAWFCGLPFYVNQSVLVPRSPIAELIKNDYRPWVVGLPATILDLCCGSGCIGIAAALGNPNSKVVVSDISSAAIDVAKRNIGKHQCEMQVEAICADLFEGVQSRRFDLILCNPPYVDKQDMQSMPKEYQHEPEIGLGSGEDGLDLSRKILAQAADYLTEEGVLILEVGNSWVNLEEAFPKFGFVWIEFESGGHGVCAITRKELRTLNNQHN